MKRVLGGLLAALALVAAPAMVRAQEGATLDLGDKAPPLTVSKFVKGDAVKEFDSNTFYVVEFWATWCGPCRVSIPHLTELQKEYASKGVKFVGVSVWEQDQKEVEPFVKEMGDKMDYIVAMDDVEEGKEGSDGKMAKAWMEASGSNGIPTAFVVGKDGKIAWIGHPMELEKPLAKIVAGEFDVAAAAAERKEQRMLESKFEEAMAAAIPAYRSEKYDVALKAIDEALKETPALSKTPVSSLKFELLIKTKAYDKAKDFGMELIEGPLKEQSNSLNTLAWTLIDPEGDETPKELLPVALAAAKKASSLTDDENPAVLDTYALALFKSGDKKKALEIQQKAVKLSDPDELEPSMKARLEQYEKAVDEDK
jgi:thiol-disulfide isomerase/thioredoxin